MPTSSSDDHTKVPSHYATLPPLLTPAEDLASFVHRTFTDGPADSRLGDTPLQPLAAPGVHALKNGIILIQNVKLFSEPCRLESSLNIFELLQRINDRLQQMSPTSVLKPPHYRFYNCWLHANNIENVTLVGAIDIHKCYVSHSVHACDVVLSGPLNILNSRIAGSFSLNNCWIHGGLTVQHTRFEHVATLQECRLDSGVVCCNSSFAYGPNVPNTSFLKKAEFINNSFDRCSFSGAWFPPETCFTHCDFVGDADFRSASFGSRSKLASNAWLGTVRFAGCLFGRHSGIEDSIPRLSLGRRTYLDLKWLRANVQQRFGWHVVRTLGELAILTRASYLALIVVPIAAGLWPWIGRVLGTLVGADAKWGLPIEWGLVWVAALATAIAHLLYQLFADATVRNSTSRGLQRFRLEEFAKADAHGRDILLRSQFEWLRKIALLMPHYRHRNIVDRHGRDEWIPTAFDDLVNNSQRRGSGMDTANGSSLVKDDTDGLCPRTVGEEPEPLDDCRQPMHTRGEMDIITIEEGARAEYDVCSRKNRGWAATALALYIAAALAVAWLLLLQLWLIAHQIASRAALSTTLILFGVTVAVVIVTLVSDRLHYNFYRRDKTLPWAKRGPQEERGSSDS